MDEHRVLSEVNRETIRGPLTRLENGGLMKIYLLGGEDGNIINPKQWLRYIREGGNSILWTGKKISANEFAKSPKGYVLFQFVTQDINVNNIPFDKVVYFPQWENFIKPGEMNGEFRLQAKIRLYNFFD